MFATREDIFACFRLLLGREPHPEEIEGHCHRVGTPLAVVVAGYLESLEFRNRGLLGAPLRAECVELESFRIYIDAEDHLIGAGIRSSYEPEVTRAFIERVRPESCVIDFGANCGYYSLLASSLGASVYAFEPLERNVRLLAASRIANGYKRLEIIAAAASDLPGTLAIGHSYTNAIVGAVPRTPEAALAASYTAAVRADDSIPTDKPVSVIKADVEGHEYRALCGAAGILERWHPAILMEFSPSGLEANSGVSGRACLEWLASRGYRFSVIGNEAATGIKAVLEQAAGHHHIDILATVQ